MMQGLLEVKENLQKVLGREPNKGELAEATSMSMVQVKKHLEAGRAARNKLIKVCSAEFAYILVLLIESLWLHMCRREINW